MFNEKIRKRHTYSKLINNTSNKEPEYEACHITTKRNE